MYFLNSFLILLKKAWNEALKMPSNSLPEADLNLPEMKTNSPSCPLGGVHMYAEKIFFSGVKSQWPWILVLASLFKWWPWVHIDLFYGKVRFGPLCFCVEKR